MPFKIFAPDNCYIFVSSPEQIKEIDSAPDNVLSLQAASRQVCHDSSIRSVRCNGLTYLDATTEILDARFQLVRPARHRRSRVHPHPENTSYEPLARNTVRSSLQFI
jgi:hypothetical protein